MKKAIIVALALVALVAAPQAFAQAAGGGTAASTTPDIGAPSPAKIGDDAAQQALKQVSVDKFEASGFWTAYMAGDDGYVQARLFEGSPAGKEGIPDEGKIGQDLQTADKFVLGVRTDFFRRGQNEIYVMANKPVPIEGVTKTISVWVVGRNYNHRLLIILQDFFGNRFELPMGTLNFQGWKKLTVAVPPQNPDGMTGIIQRNYHFTNQTGIKVLGFKIDCDPMEAFGTYYIYFDDLRAWTDLFAEVNRDKDDMADNW
jgi:hypothetical protein